VEILERIKGLEDKLDTLSSEGAFPSSAALHAQPLATTLSPVAIPSAPPTLTHLHGTYFQLHDTSSTSASSGPDDHYKYVSSVHHMLSWPSVQQLFAAAQPKISTIDLAAVERERPTGMLRLHSPPNHTLPTSSSLMPTRPGSSVSVHGQTTGALPIAISGLTWDTMQRLSKAYFNSFHLLSPILDRHSFLSNIRGGRPGRFRRDSYLRAERPTEWGEGGREGPTARAGFLQRSEEANGVQSYRMQP
jgi:hypothetical protein